MISYDAIEETVFDFIVLATGLNEDQVRRSYQNASAQPTQDREMLVSFNLINQTSIGIDSSQFADRTGDDDLDETVKGDRNVTASIKAYGDNAQNTIEKIGMFGFSASGNEFLNKNALGFLNKGQVLDISSVQNGSFEKRRQLDIEFHVVLTTETVTGSIGSADIGFAFYGSETITGTIEVTP